MASKGETIYFGCLVCLFLLIGSANSEMDDSDKLLQGQKLKNGDQLVSAAGTFRLGFFNENERIYIGIFYKHPSDYGLQRSGDNYHYILRSRYHYNRHTAVWVANLNNPIVDKSGVLTIDSNGDLKILASLGNPIPISSVNVSGKTCASATLLDTGNLVVNELNLDGSVKRLLWQSFDYPTDTLLPGMKLGIRLQNGHTWSLTSGSFSFGLDHNNINQLKIWWAGDVYWTSGIWLNGKFNQKNELSNKHFRFQYVSNEEEKYFMYEVDRHVISTPMLKLRDDGYLADSTERIVVSCGGDVNYRDKNWYYQVSDGCVYKEYKTCRKDKPYDFVFKKGSISGDRFKYNESYHLGILDCSVKCERNCSCVAYAPTDETNNNGCQIWSNIRIETSVHENPQGVYMFVNRSHVQEHKERRRGYHNITIPINWFVWLIFAMGGSLVLSIPCSMVFGASRRQHRDFIVKCLGLLTRALHIWRRCEQKLVQYIESLKKKDTEHEILLEELGFTQNENPRRPGIGSHELQFLSFESISLATNNFASMNKLGEGGFGPVYKGQLLDGQEVAIKRLSRNSKQGLVEFKNEVKIIAKLQHNNLVKLVGCCVEKEEKILVYEYMPNKSLDFFLFYPKNQNVLDWKTRFNIIEGISHGLLYLHKHSRLKIVHRDLKSSNILLDHKMNPKISDFGMARIFGPDESKANTKQLVGTYGYISPEFVSKGIFSTKSDVFSFGVLLLEIVTGRKNNSFKYSDSHLSLITYVWELWKQGRHIELIDPVLGDSVCQKEVFRCIHIGLLCVQENRTDRPTMSDVISMLYNEANQLPSPKEPAFYYRRNFPGTKEAEHNQERLTFNDVSITEMEAR